MAVAVGVDPIRAESRLARRFRAAAVAANVDASWHDLRHHHASVLLSAGVSPALVAERLGHDVKTLLSTYAHVIRADEDRVRKLVDDALGGTAEEWLTDRLRTGAVCEPSISSCYRRSEHV